MVLCERRVLRCTTTDRVGHQFVTVTTAGLDMGKKRRVPTQQVGGATRTNIPQSVKGMRN